MKKILIVDDQKAVKELVDVTLRGGEYHILKAENEKRPLRPIRWHELKHSRTFWIQRGLKKMGNSTTRWQPPSEVKV